MRIPGANSPKPNFSRYAPRPEPESLVEYKNTCPSPSKSQTQKDTANSKDPRPPDPTPQKRARRIPRSEIRALYRTLTPAQLEERVQIAKDILRETMLEYIYSTHKPNSPLPSLMQMRMHPPIARVAQDLDEVDQALKRAREVGQTGLAPIPTTGSSTTARASPRATTQRPPAAKKEKKVNTPKEKPPPTMIPDPNNPGQMIKRGRGRPKKYLIAPPKDPVVPDPAAAKTRVGSTQEVSHSASQGSSRPRSNGPDPNNPGQMIKRGRGRPRKYPIAPPKDPVVPDPAAAKATSEPSRKKLKTY
jgi:hypothetical protein